MYIIPQEYDKVMSFTTFFLNKIKNTIGTRG
jgi:hypothetical protein